MGLPKEGSRIVLNFAILLLMVWTVGIFLVNIVLSDESVNDDYIVAAKIVRQINNDPSDKIIIFGSSMGREGLDQQYIQNQLNGVKVYNLSVSSGKPSDFYLMLARIRLNNRIKLVVITLSPWIFQKKYTDDVISGNDVFTNLFFNPFKIGDIARFRELKSDWFIDSTISSFNPFYRYNSYFRKIIDQNQLSFWRRPSERSKATPWEQYAYRESKPESYFVDELGKDANYAEYKNDNFYWDAGKNIQITALRKLTNELFKNNILTLAIDMPVNPYKEKLYDNGLIENYRASIKLPLTGSKYHDFSFVYPKDNFIDFNHLNVSGRARFSQDILVLISRDYGF